MCNVMVTILNFKIIIIKTLIQFYQNSTLPVFIVKLYLNKKIPVIRIHGVRIGIHSDCFLKCICKYYK